MFSSSVEVYDTVAHRGQLQTNVYWCIPIYADVNKYILMQKEKNIT